MPSADAIRRCRSAVLARPATVTFRPRTVEAGCRMPRMGASSASTTAEIWARTVRTVQTDRAQMRNQTDRAQMRGRRPNDDSVGPEPPAVRDHRERGMPVMYAPRRVHRRRSVLAFCSRVPPGYLDSDRSVQVVAARWSTRRALSRSGASRGIQWPVPSICSYRQRPVT